MKGPADRNVCPIVDGMKEWVFAPRNDVLLAELSARLDISPVTAGVLAARGIGSVDEARRFLSPQLTDLIDPALLPDMTKAVDTICRHARLGSPIVVYGDYDVDGTCAVTILLQFLRLAGLDPTWFVPEREEEGYGLHASVLKTLKEKGAGLVITVDCGISSVEEAKAARDLGLELVITDHHEPGKQLPDAAAVVNPKIVGSKYPFKDLAGVGVAFKLAWALAERLSRGEKTEPHFRKFLLDSMALVAMGTIADVVPLVGENRVFAKFGLQALRYCEMPGVQALLAQCGLTDAELTATDVSFKLAPRLNVAGRMASAALAMNLLMSESYGDGERIATKLEELNRERQRIQREIMETAKRRIEAELSPEDRIIVLADESWPVGIVGIVASHIVEQYYRPALLIALNGDYCRGSARSIPELNIVEALASCGEHLASFGGHAQAAGIRIARHRVESFRIALIAHVNAVLAEATLAPRLDVDGEVLLDSLSRSLVGELDRLAPFGEGAPEPVLAARNVRVAGRPRRVGGLGQHLSFFVTQGTESFRCIAFGMGDVADRLPPPEFRFHIAFVPELDNFSGREGVQLRIKDFDFGEEDTP
jgi:single-stranded-DNA-specific exonuclease